MANDNAPYFQDESVTLHHGDALDLPLPDSSVDLVVTSPPYFGLRSYQDNGEHYAGQIGSETTPAEFVDALIAATAEMVRVLKPSGSIWVNLGDKYAERTGPERLAHADTDAWVKRPNYRAPRRSYGFKPKSLMGLPWRYALRCIDDLGLILRAELIWDKPNGMPESVTDRVRRSHEQWFHFTTRPRYFANVDQVRETPSGYHRGPVAVAQIPGQKHRAMLHTSNPLGKLSGSVWHIPTKPLKVPESLGVDHFAAFPMEWPRRIIQGWSPVGGIVLDPFGGTGTTALMAKTLGRQGISVDMSEDYCRLARWRTTDPDQIASAMQVAKPAKQVEGQWDLFMETGDAS